MRLTISTPSSAGLPNPARARRPSGGLRAIRAAIRRLKRAPCLYAVGQRRGTREFSVAGHRVIYRVTPDTGSNATAGDVLVLRVFGPGQSRTER